MHVRSVSMLNTALSYCYKGGLGSVCPMCAQSPPPAPAMYRPGVPPPGSSAQNAAAAAAGGNPPPAPAPTTMPQGLQELDIHLFLDALLDVLCDKVTRRQVTTPQTPFRVLIVVHSPACVISVCTCLRCNGTTTPQKPCRVLIALHSCAYVMLARPACSALMRLLYGSMPSWQLRCGIEGINAHAVQCRAHVCTCVLVLTQGSCCA